MWTRRAVAVGVGVLLVIFLAVVVNACQDSRRKNSLRNYNREVAAIVNTSDTEVGAPFFEGLAQGAGQGSGDLQAAVSSLRATADTNLEQAQDLSVPGDLSGAQESLLISMELRRDGLQYVSERVGTALGEQGDEADRAFEEIAGQMQAFLASDVLLRTRVTPLIRTALEDNEVVADPVTTAGFLPSFEWLAPEFVADQLGQVLTDGGSSGGGGGGTEEVAPGLHGNGLESTEINGIALTPGADVDTNRVPLESATALTVVFANQGENTEFDVNVLVTLQGSSGTDITGSQVVDTIAAGDTATVEVPLSREPEADVYQLNVEVQQVPGEKKTDNNESTYNVLFE